MGECDGVGAVHREVAISRGVYSARVAEGRQQLTGLESVIVCWHLRDRCRG
jgi:hypothetical protein